MAEPKKKARNYNASLIKRVMRKTTNGHYRIGADVVDVVSPALEEFVRKLAFNSALLAANSGRVTIKGKDVKAALAMKIDEPVK
jgi:histone H3/H4